MIILMTLVVSCSSKSAQKAEIAHNNITNITRHEGVTDQCRYTLYRVFYTPVSLASMEWIYKTLPAKGCPEYRGGHFETYNGFFESRQGSKELAGVFGRFEALYNAAGAHRPSARVTVGGAQALIAPLNTPNTVVGCDAVVVSTTDSSNVAIGSSTLAVCAGQMAKKALVS